MNPKVKIASVIIVILLFAAGFFIFDGQREVLASVGDIEITKTQLELKKKILNIRRSDVENPISDVEALSILIREAKDEAVYRDLGGNFNESELKALSNQVNDQTLASDLLGRIKQALGGDASPEYLEIYIKPLYIRGGVIQLLSNELVGESAQRRRERQLHEYIKRAKTGESFAVMREDGYYQVRFNTAFESQAAAQEAEFNEVFKDFDSEGYETYQDLARAQEDLLNSLNDRIPTTLFSEEATKDLIEKLTSLDTGDVLSELYNFKGSAAAVMINAKEDSTNYVLDVLTIPFSDIPTAYENQVQQFPVEIHKVNLRRQYNNL